MRRYRDVCEKLRTSEGRKIYNAFLSIRVTLYTFQRNFKELDSLIRLHYKLQLENKLGDFLNQEPLHEFLFEVTRRLHNFAFSAKSLVNHTRNFVIESYGEGSTIHEEYQREVANCFAATGIADFTTGLRNFFGHVSAPFINSVMGGSDACQRERFTLTLDIEEMERSQKFRGWTRGARKYIDTHGGGVDLGIYVVDYYELIMRFYHWLGERNEAWCKPAWDHTLALQDEIVEYEKRWDISRERITGI